VDVGGDCGVFAWDMTASIDGGLACWWSGFLCRGLFMLGAEVGADVGERLGADVGKATVDSGS
jgi:hypothetical protein